MGTRRKQKQITKKGMDLLKLTYQKWNSQLESREHSNLMFMTVVASSLMILFTLKLSINVELNIELPELPIAGSLLALILIFWRVISETYDAKQYNALMTLEDRIWGNMSNSSFQTSTDQGEFLKGKNKYIYYLEKLRNGEIGLDKWMRKCGRGKTGFARSILILFFIVVSTFPWLYVLGQQLFGIIKQQEALIYVVVFLLAYVPLFSPEVVRWFRWRETQTKGIQVRGMKEKTKSRKKDWVIMTSKDKKT